MPGAILAGGVAGLAWMLPPLGYLLWPITAGVLGVVLYHRRRPDAIVSPGTGARIGAITGLFGFLLFALLLVISLIGAGRAKFRESLDQAFQQALARNPDPKAQEIMQNFMTPAGIAVMFVLVAVVIFVFLVGISSLGGVLGAKLMRKQGPEDRR